MTDDEGNSWPETAIKRYAFRPGVRRQPRLEWRDATGKHVKLVAHRATVGAAPSSDIVVADPTVSRIHAELDPRDDGLWVRDLGSKNGVFIGGVLVTGGRVPPGGIVRVGSTDITVDLVEERSSDELWPSDRFGPLVGQTRVMRELFHYLSSIATSDASVLIRGETGTGKELVARSIHDASARRDGPFVVVDCGAIPENLIESELFGSAKGAYTGAQATRQGAIESANGGTVFFDEIGELPISMQPKLLRVLETREVRRLGETQSRRVDVRFLAASHRDLRNMVNIGAFREDLYFRLAVLPVSVPPLRERSDDIPALVQSFLPPNAHPVDAAVLEQLKARPWLGNVRELRNFVERGLAVGIERALRMSVVPPPGSPLPGRDIAETGASLAELAQAAPTPGATHATGDRPSDPAPEPPSAAPLPVSTRQQFKAFREQWIDYGEREYVRDLLARHARKVSAAAEEAGLDRTYLYRLIRKHLP